MNAIAVGVDVSKGKSMVTALRFPLEMVVEPYEIRHTENGLNNFVALLSRLDGNVRVVVESTGHHHAPVVEALYEAGIFVSVVNPKVVSKFRDVALRQVKTDKQDAITLARYGLKYWEDLRAFSPVDTLRRRLKECSRQYHLYTDAKIKLKNNLVALLD